MDKKKTNKLIKLNQKFYKKIQVYFNSSRQHYWQGWEKLVPYLNLQGDSLKVGLKVLDVGCGNGRFGEFLINKGLKINYWGIDNNEYLLKKARDKIQKGKFLKQDVFKAWNLNEKFDLVTILGVMHHLPTEKMRTAILKKAVDYLNNKGILFLSFWLFDKSNKNKVVKTLGKNDYILSWKRGVEAERYCHFYTKKEINQLIQLIKAEKLAGYIEDKSNYYLILRRN